MLSKSMLLLKTVRNAIIATAFAVASIWAQTPVRIWEEPLVIPTYKIGEPERNPMFYSGRAYQGAKGPIYPYPLLDKITDIREDKTYKAVYLENQYIKLCVLPEIGGRILSAQDKTNGYDFIYHQHVIKPSLIGMLGAWISGGVEWNVPHHHRATTYMTIDHTIEENPDGSKTIWVGEVELRHRMKWIVGLTLHPDKSYIEATAKLINRTPFVHTSLFFANVAVHANENYQVIFPPSTEFATYHAKTQFSRWPISNSVFNGVDYTRGVDVSWWKNHPAPTSWFAWNYEEDFFGGYDHGKQAGIVHIADHHVVPGKKFFEWGNGPEGVMWDKILTETDGPYLELMAGAYSDNQPDYSWIQPYEVKMWKQFWYPIRQLGGIKNANLDAAVNLEMGRDGVARIALNTTHEVQGARVLLRAGEKVLLDKRLDTSPEKPFTEAVPLPLGVKEDDLSVMLLSPSNKELISYRPLKPKDSPIPEPVRTPLPPKVIKTVEELYLTGLRLEQFYSPAFEPYPYYEEALRRDPADSRVNTALGILYCKRGMFAEAEAKFRTALKRLTHDYTSPKDGEASYYLGVALSSQGKDADAYDAFYKATWSNAWRAAGYFQLAQIASRHGHYAQALDFVERSILANGLNTKAINMKAALTRRMGHNDEAAQLAASVLASDPLDFLAGNESCLTNASAGKPSEAKKCLEELTVLMHGAVQSYLELATDYGAWGMWDEAIDALSRYAGVDESRKDVNPMVHYYLGYFWEMKGDEAKAREYYEHASSMRPDYCFPFRMESIRVLEKAMKKNPRDARAPYYLGNLLYDLQPENAIKAWETARILDDGFATVHRNLGFAYARVEKNLSKAIASMEQAIACNKRDPRLYYERDLLYEAAGVSPEKRLQLLEANQQTVLERDDAVQQQITLYVLLGQYDKAIEMVTNRHFHVWEGGGDIHDVYINAHLLRGHQHFRDKRYREALQDYEAALDYPENLEVGRPYRPDREPEILYFLGLAHARLGKGSKAQTFYEKAVAEKIENSPVLYFQGLAYRKLGKEAQAGAIFAGLIKSGTTLISETNDVDYFAKFGGKRSKAAVVAHAHYLMALGYLGQDKQVEAKAEFQKVLRHDGSHLGARTQLTALK
jgi:tetratricopeptide (TPR) repeat protein